MDKESAAPPPDHEKKNIGRLVFYGLAVAVFMWAGAASLFYKFPETQDYVVGIKNDFKNLHRITANVKNPPKIFYYIEDREQAGSEPDPQYSTHYKIYLSNLGLEKSDTLLHQFSIPGHGFAVTNSWKKGVLLFATSMNDDSIIYALRLDQADARPEIILKLPRNSVIGEAVNDARYIDGGEKLAYVTDDGVNDRAEHSVLHIVSVKNPKLKETYPLNEKSEIYAGFRFLAVTPDNKTLFLEDAGGDGGDSWSDWYRVDRSQGTVEKLDKLPPLARGQNSEDENSIYDISPDATRVAYANFSTKIDPDDLANRSVDTSDMVYSRCLKEAGFDGNFTKQDEDKLLKKYAQAGGVIILHDLKSNISTEVYRDLSSPHYPCLNIVRRIISAKWTSETQLVYETVNGIFSLDVNTKQSKRIFEFVDFDGSMWGKFKVRPLLYSVHLPYIFLSDHSVIHLDEKKWLKFDTELTRQRRYFVIQ
jgi:hypothetical protein